MLVAEPELKKNMQDRRGILAPNRTSKHQKKDSHFSLFLGVFGVCCGSFSPQEDVKLALKWFPDQQDDSIGINESVDFLKRPVYYYPN